MRQQDRRRHIQLETQLGLQEVFNKYEAIAGYIMTMLPMVTYVMVSQGGSNDGRNGWPSFGWLFKTSIQCREWKQRLVTSAWVM
jgi:hypothetical protein